ncbi:hypothetical protein ASB1_03800 [Helicobacter heilmannii]|nr:hypothetical protein ASB1_03800 [Helicobacter heilmannii]
MCHAILEAILTSKATSRSKATYHFGTGASVEHFLNALTPEIFNTPTQKYFVYDG